jgi:FixJ family two-component response regulator
MPAPVKNLVVVVDDDPAILRSLDRLLLQFGYRSLLFSSAEAFATHRDFEAVLCIILDINLGDGSGIEQRQRLRNENVDVPVIYITGNDNPSVREAALRSGCLAYFTKPFSAELLKTLLEEASAPVVRKNRLAAS